MSSQGSLCGWRSFTSICWLWLMVCFMVTLCCGVTLTPWQAGKWKASVCPTTSVPWETAACLSAYACPGLSLCSDPKLTHPPAVASLSQGDGGGPMAGIYHSSLCPPYLMASCFLGEWRHNWFCSLWNVFGCLSHATCVACYLACIYLKRVG